MLQCNVCMYNGYDRCMHPKDHDNTELQKQYSGGASWAEPTQKQQMAYMAALQKMGVQMQKEG